MVLENWPQRSAVLVEQEHTRSNPPQDPLQRDIRDWTNPAKKRKNPGKGNHNQDQAGHPDEVAGQRRLNDFGKKTSES